MTMAVAEVCVCKVCRMWPDSREAAEHRDAHFVFEAYLSAVTVFTEPSPERIAQMIASEMNAPALETRCRLAEHVSLPSHAADHR